MKLRLKTAIHYKKYAIGVFWVLFLILLLNYHFFYLIPYPSVVESILGGNKYFALMGVFGVFFFLLLFAAVFKII